jgi:uncharacterized membrane-anchored protein
MKNIHAPRVDTRYWTAITLASVFGTNMGDFYAHESGLGIVNGLLVLAACAALVFIVERFENVRHEVYYWLVIMFIRTGATNIADWLAYRAKAPEPWLTLSIAALIALFALGTRSAVSKDGNTATTTLPNTNPAYWMAMLGCGVFGTVLGDVCEHKFGEGFSAIALSVILLVVIVAWGKRAVGAMALYWTIVAIARTAGTGIGDWLADEKFYKIGLSWSTLLTGVVFTGVLIFWRGSAKTAGAATAPA